MVFGAIAGSTTFRDPLFLVAELLTGLFVRRWWHLIVLALVVSVSYTLLFNGVPAIQEDASIRWWPFIGRAFSVLIVGSAIAVVVDAFRYISRSPKKENA
jgi:hypothetical protein